MRAGKLDRRVTLERFTSTVNEFNEPIETWAPIATVWAELVQETGREFLAQSEVTAERKAVFRIRYRAGITVRDRVIYDGRAHNIVDVRELGRRKGLELHTVVGAD